MRYAYLSGLTQGSDSKPSKPKNSLLTTDSIDGWIELGWARSTDSGLSVSSSTAKTYSSVWQALQIISGDVARVALNRFDRGPADERIARYDVPEWRCLNQLANAYCHAYTLRETMTAQALLLGNAYALIVRDPLTKRVRGLVLLDPRRVQPFISQDGELLYSSAELDRTIAAADVFHLRGLGDDSIEGTSVITLARNSFGLGLAAEKHGNKTMKNGAGPRIVLKHPDQLSADEANELLDRFEARHVGSENTGRPALAAGGLDIETLPISNENAQWLESRQFQRQEVAAWFCLPPHKLGDMTRSAFNSVEAEDRNYVSGTLMRWFYRWKIEAETKFLTETERQARSYWEHNTEALVQGDFNTQTTMLVELKNACIMRRSEARRKLNLPVSPEDEIYENSNTTAGTTTTASNSSSSAATAAVRQLVAKRFEQLVRTEGAQVRHALTGANAAAESLVKLYDSLEPKFVEALEPIVEVLRSLNVSCPSAQSLASKHCQASQLAVLELLTDKGLPRELLGKAVAELVSGWQLSAVASICQTIFGD